MDQALAEARLKNMLSWQTDPALDQEDIDMLIVACRRTDSSGRMWDDASWIPTFSLDWAAAEGWAWKSGAVSNRYRISGDATDLERHQIFQHCQKMYELYKKRSHQQPQAIRSQGATLVDRLGTWSTVPWWWEISA